MRSAHPNVHEIIFLKICKLWNFQITIKTKHQRIEKRNGLLRKVQVLMQMLVKAFLHTHFCTHAFIYSRLAIRQPDFDRWFHCRRSLRTRLPTRAIHSTLTASQVFFIQCTVHTVHTHTHKMIMMCFCFVCDLFFPVLFLQFWCQFLCLLYTSHISNWTRWKDKNARTR